MRVFTNGCFDIIHRGHVELFNYAASLGDTLWVAIDSDERVRRMKGEGRPINNQDDRMGVLYGMRYIYSVSVFNTDEELSAIVKRVKPDIMVVGSDWKDKPIVGSEHAKEVQFFDRVFGYSTTDTIGRCGNR